MSEVVRLKTQPEIDREAAVWTWRLDDEALDEGERARFEAWLREDPRHRRAHEELRRTWSALDDLKHGVPPEARHGIPNAPPIPRAGHLPRLVAAAAVLVLAIGAALWLHGRPTVTRISTAIGEERHVALPDGSQVALNTHTALEVRFTPRRREVYLLRGEAHFEVRHDAHWPFFVHAAHTVVRDVGTQFEVRLRADRAVEVLVDEGRVQVQERAGSAGSSTPGAGSTVRWVRSLRAGEQLSIAGPHPVIASLTPGRIADALAWRDGALVFQSEPLSRAVAEVARYTPERIVLADPRVAALRISGRFRTDDVRGFFAALKTALPVRVTQPSPGVVEIGARPAHPQLLP